MEIKIRGQNLELTDKIKSYSEEKINKLTKYFDHIMEAEIELIAEKNPSISDSQIAEVTVFTKGHVLRAKEASSDIFASIDLVSAKLERQLKKYKDKMYKSSKRRPQVKEDHWTPEQIELSRIVKVKEVVMKPMTPEEATMQLDLLGHEFFVFTNSDTEEVNVVYKRNDDNYGLIKSG